MPNIASSACAKLILLGEHAVVYGQPALAIPFSSQRIKATVEPLIGYPSGLIRIIAPQLGLDTPLEELSEDNLIAQALTLSLEALELTQRPTCVLRIHSSFPFASGLGSSAAITIAIARAISSFVGHPLPVEEVNAIAFKTEQLMHGNPSGIDNTVIAYERPLVFTKGFPVEFVTPGDTFHFIVADTGVKKSTALTVAQLAQHRLEHPQRVDSVILKIGNLVGVGSRALLSGDNVALGLAMTDNQGYLHELGLSSPELDTLINKALEAGSLGAKLTGGGQGGHMIALVNEADISTIQQALLDAGAKTIYTTRLEKA